MNLLTIWSETRKAVAPSRKQTKRRKIQLDEQSLAKSKARHPSQRPYQPATEKTDE
jgi:hypothetical protein